MASRISRTQLEKIPRKYNSQWRKLNGPTNSDYKYVKEWKQTHPKKTKAQQQVSLAIREGRNKKRPCIVCKSRFGIVAHHPNYNEPLEVVFLCRPHHRQVHYAEKRLGLTSKIAA